MKEIYLAKDWNNAVFGYSNLPCRGRLSGVWHEDTGKTYPPSALLNLGIDVTKFPISHETPIKIRAVWEAVNE